MFLVLVCGSASLFTYSHSPVNDQSRHALSFVASSGSQWKAYFCFRDAEPCWRLHHRYMAPLDGTPDMHIKKNSSSPFKLGGPLRGANEKAALSRVSMCADLERTGASALCTRSIAGYCLLCCLATEGPPKSPFSN